jgi:ubiquinone/menaquinone biosynthesis C-methylase UbiE
MDPRLQKRVQRYGWDKASDQYDGFWAKQLEPAQTRMIEMAALERGEHVLDTACGTGLVTFRAAEAVGPDGRVVGTDISEEMVRMVSEIASQRGISHVSFERMDAEALALDDASFDAALCGLGLMYFPDPIKAFKEMARVLRPDGRVGLAVWGARQNCGWAEIFPIVDARVKSEVCPLFFQLGTGDALRHTMSAAGLVDIEIDRLTTTLHYDSAEDAIGAAFAGGPVAMAYSRFDSNTREAVHREYLASIDDFRHGERYEIPGEFVIARGGKT